MIKDRVTEKEWETFQQQHEEKERKRKRGQLLICGGERLRVGEYYWQNYGECVVIKIIGRAIRNFPGFLLVDKFHSKNMDGCFEFGMLDEADSLGRKIPAEEADKLLARIKEF